MSDKINQKVLHYIKKQEMKRKIVTTLLVLSLFVATGVFWTLKLNGIALAGEAFCGNNEHKHSDKCYEQVLVCTIEDENHEHSDECFKEKLICQTNEHTHTPLCFSNKSASLENESDWKATLPNDLTSNWNENLVKVAMSQIGYEESKENFIIDDDGKTKKGYTRYGEWYGNEYGHWEAMFVSFCLNYANIPQEAISHSAGIQTWKASLENKGIFETNTYQPKVGDIVFFKNKVGIISKIDHQLHLIEGNASNKVSENKYDLNDQTILGYVNIEKVQNLFSPKNNIKPLDLETLVTNTSNSIHISGNLLEGTKVKADKTNLLVNNQNTDIYNIQLYKSDDTVYSLDGNTIVNIDFTLNDIEENSKLFIYRLSNTGELEPINANISQNHISFETNAIDQYAIIRADANTVTSETELINTINSNAQNITIGANFTVRNPISLTNKNFTLDLNGYEITANNTLFNVNANSTITIIDSQAKTETITTLNELSYGSLASLDGDKLTYYVTDSKVVNAQTGETKETLEKHEVLLSGRIKGTSQVVINNNGGIINLNSGMIYNGTNRAFNQTNGTLNLNGGYIFNFVKSGVINTGDQNFGGAIIASNGKINLSGTVLAANKALNGGSIYVKDKTTLTIKSGVISGNESTRNSGNWSDHSEGASYRCGGGAIFMTDDSILEMSGGYITNNKAADDDYFDGGGAILYAGKSEVILNGGYVTGNYTEGGGGAIRSDWNKNTKFTMNNGYVSANYAKSAEGGGIAITQGGIGYINGGYITNNITDTHVHWGGGGVFCSDGSYLYVKDVNVTNNNAGGFGGGVAGCSTGRVYVTVKDGGAIYKNTADGQNMSGGSSQKHEDHTYGKDSPVFMANGYQDYFCALNSLVEGGMLGGGNANWSGSCDGVPVINLPKDATLEASYVMGLTANPNDTDIKSAQNEAKLFINGNDSYTHGGGILCNGYLIIGDKNPIAVGSRFKLEGTKKLLDENNKDFSLEGYSFKFSVKDENGNIVSIGTSDQNGSIVFDRLLSFSKELCETKIKNNGQSADFTYYLTEDSKQENTDITTDQTQYKIIVTITRQDNTLPIYDADGKQIIREYYKISTVKVQKSTDNGQTWTNANYTWKGSNDEQHGGTLKITNGTTFTNHKKKTTHYKVVKKWVGVDENNLPDFVTVDLLRDGKIIDTVILNSENNWTYFWDKLAEGYTYSVHEHPVPGYDTDITYGLGTVEKPGWIPATSLVEGRTYILVTHEGSVLLGDPKNHNGAYTFDSGNFRTIQIIDDFIAKDIINDNDMLWDVAKIEGKPGIYIKNLPSTGKHYLSFQDTNRVQVSSNNTGYASRVSIENGYLKIQHQNETNKPDNYKYVVKDGNTLKASDDSTNAVRLFTLNTVEDENIATITNTKTSDLYDLDIHKVNALDKEEALSGAIFNLLNGENTLTFRIEDNKYVYDPSGTVIDLETGEDGYIHITGLPEGEYVLKETTAPEGFEIADEITVSVGEGNTEVPIEVTVEDQPIVFELPETGGKGTQTFILTGLLLMVIPFVYKYIFERQKKV